MNNKVIFAFINLTTIPCFADWSSLIESKKSVMTTQTYNIISSQLASWQSGNAPKIVSSEIKSIPIVESEEAVIDIRTCGSKCIAMMPDPITPFETPDCNAGFKASSKIRLGLFNTLHVLEQQLDALAQHFGYTAGQIKIKVFEGLRDIATQKMLFDNKMQEIQNANAMMTQERVFSETCKWVSPVINNVPVHSTGAAIDIRLWDTINNQFIDMGKFGVIWGANPAAPTFSEELTDEQKNNRLFLVIAANQAGLINYLYEWWHFSCGDRYASFWLESDPAKRQAIYGSI